MDKQEKSTAGQGLGIAGLILGIISIPLSVTGCTFVSGLVIGILGITFSAIGLSQAKRASAQTGLIMAALIISIIGTSFAIIRLTNSFTRHDQIPFKILKEKLETLEENTDDFERVFEEEFEKELGDDLESVLKDLESEYEDDFENLEKEFEDLKDEIDRTFDELSDEEKARKLGKAAGKALREFLDEIKDTTETD